MASFKHPWMVESIEAFSFYCCPECTFRSKEENFFEAHALQNHDLSRYLFQENFVQDMKIDIKVESSEAKHDLKDQFGQHFLANTNVQVKTEFEDFIDDADVSPPEDDDENVELVSEKSLECDECGKKCKNQKHFTNHKRYHKSLNGPQEYCEKCDRNIPEKFFPSHCLSVHPGEYDEEGDPHASDLSIGGNETNLQCDICGKKCRDKKHYRNHILHHKYFKKDLPDSEPQSKEDIKQFGNLAHSEDDSLRCPDCGKICKDKSHFKNHKLHHKFLKNAERIDCEKCNKNMPKKFYESHSLKCKMTGFKKDPALRCEECGKHCRDEKSFAFHKRYHKRKNEALANENEMDKEPPNEDPEFAQNLQCDECDKVCKTQKQLTHHKHYHKYYLNGPQIFCQICDKNIPEKLFVRHVDTVHPGDPGLKDGLEVKSEDGLTNHLRKIAKKKQHNWTINKDGIFADKSETIFHQAKGHWNNFCKLVYTNHEQPPTEEQVLDYMKLKKEAGRSSSMVVEYKKGLGRVYQYLFNMEFKSPKIDEYIENLKIMEPDSALAKAQHDPGICPHCGEHFNYLKKHIQYKHSIDKPWQCDECDYTHALKGGIVEHKKYNHKKETEYFFCNLCSYKSPSQNNLKSHDEMVHQKIKRFTCHQCPRQFYRNNQLQMHIRDFQRCEKAH